MQTPLSIADEPSQVAVASQILAACTTHLDLTTVLNRTLRGALTLTDMEGGTICLCDWEQRVLKVAAAENTSSEVLEELHRCPVAFGGCLCGDAVETGQPVVFWDHASSSPLAVRDSVRKDAIRFHASLPLQVQGRTIGILCVFARSDARPTQRSLDLVRELCGAVALTIENARMVARLREEIGERKRLEEDARYANRRLELITRITGSVIGRQTVAELAEHLAAQVRDCFGVDVCVIRLLEDEELVLLGMAGAPPEQMSPRLPVFGLGKEILATRRPLVIPNVFADTRTRPITTPKPGAYSFTAYAGVPLLAGEETLGVMGIYVTAAPREFTPVDLDHLQIFANHVAITLCNERLYRTVRAQQTKLELEMAERRQSEQARRQLEEQLRQSQKLESIGRLAAGVAHDFNNLLTIINGNTALLLEDAGQAHSTREMLDQIVAAGERAANLTRQLLVFSRKQHLQPQTLNLNELTANLDKMLGRLLGEHIALEFHCDAALPCIQADPGMIEQVIVNLVVNARDAMPDGGELRVATTAMTLTEEQARWNAEARPGPCVCLEVRDTGCGIPPEIRNRIFEPFFTTKEVGKGTGLGLATVYGIVKQHGGWVELETAVGRGTTFRVWLPASETVTRSAGMAPAPPAARGQGETILVVEDETAVRELACKLLTRHGYRVLSSASGVEALQLTPEQILRVDLLLTDMVMPGGCGGRDLAARLHEIHPHLPVIFCSGYSAEGASLEAYVRQGAVFLQKPFMPQQLLETVGRLLARRGGRVAEE